MKLLEKKMTTNKRQELDIMFWAFLSIFGSIFVYSLAVNEVWLTLVACFIMICVAKLMAKNTRLALKQMKKEKRK